MACDFLRDALTDWRTACVLAVIDEYLRECLTAKAAISHPATRVRRILDPVAEQRGAYPEVLRTDGGPEFVSAAFAEWCEAHSVYHHRNTARGPIDDGRLERLNQTISGDVLDF